MKLTRRYHIALGVVAALVAATAGMIYFMTAHGFSAHDQPTLVEALIARQMRHMGVPRNARDRANPVPDSSETIRVGMEHWADHCALCHANDGSGDTEIGRNLYPKAPDMRQRQTQELSDGELFYIIQNGVRLTGMPAWDTGTADGETSTWKLVRFVRHLPKLTDAELAEMKKLNPRSPSEMAMPNEEEFLRGDTPDVLAAPPMKHESHSGRGRGGA